MKKKAKQFEKLSQIYLYEAKKGIGQSRKIDGSSSHHDVVRAALVMQDAHLHATIAHVYATLALGRAAAPITVAQRRASR